MNSLCPSLKHSGGVDNSSLFSCISICGVFKIILKAYDQDLQANAMRTMQDTAQSRILPLILPEGTFNKSVKLLINIIWAQCMPSVVHAEALDQSP